MPRIGGPFIKMVEQEAEENAFWAESGLFSAAAIRRMLDIEFISELVVGFLHGVQDKKKKLEHYYQLYESEFEERDRVVSVFRKTSGEIEGILPFLRQTRWRKKSDFYTLFLVLADYSSEFPLSRDVRDEVRAKLLAFETSVDEFLSIEHDDQTAMDAWPPQIVRYGLAVARAATDLASRRARHEVLLGELKPLLETAESSNSVSQAIIEHGSCELHWVFSLRRPSYSEVVSQ